MLWDGSSAAAQIASPIGSICIKDRSTLLKLLRDPHLHFGHAYETDRVEIQGDLVPVLEAVDRGLREAARPAPRRRARVRPLKTRSIRLSRENIHRHYDIGNDFYQLWLDRELVYTCAYYAAADMTLEQAQEAKMELVCRKLQLHKGERVVEAGCGWGSLALYMARHYGVSVRAFNISREQIDYARARADREGLSDRVEFVDDDYRSIEGRYDVFVSVGMLEHVGRTHYRELGETIERSLDREHGRGLLHFIGRNQPEPLNAWIQRRIFPGAYPPVLREVIGDVLEPWDFTVLDVENLRLHYARTLADWLERFDASIDRVREMFDEQFVRAWRLYLAGSQATFQAGCLQLFQIAFAREGTNDVPWTRREFFWA
jgi:cyclopropane-fatty-acyl-phospholipid synthase